MVNENENSSSSSFSFCDFKLDKAVSLLWCNEYIDMNIPYEMIKIQLKLRHKLCEKSSKKI